MEIIVFVDKNGTQEGDCNFRAFDVHGEDEQSIFVIIGHSMANQGKGERVVVTGVKEHKELKSKAEQWDTYQEWLKSKKTYDRYKDRFEEE